MKTENSPRDFGFSEEETMLRDLARQFLDEHIPVEKLRDLIATDPEAVYRRGELPAWDPSLWKEMVELGWAGLAVPEAQGGVGFKLAGIAALVEEVGRHALPSPLIGTLAASFVLRAAAGENSAAWLERISAGLPMSLAITDQSGAWDSISSDIVGQQDSEEVVLEGKAYFVQDAFKADALLVAARVANEIVLCVVPAESDGVRRIQDHIYDLTRDQATISFEGVRVSPENVISQKGEPVLLSAWPALLVLVSADLCGSSEWQLQTTVEYAKQRKQFERPIGFFQAVKHPLVDAMIEIDRSRSLLYHAACQFDEEADDALVAARMAKSAASDAGAFISDRSVQLHGGIGFTWECDIHLFFKRSMHNQALYGDGVHHRRKLAETLIGPIGG